jgi:hypothetical protein
MYSKFKIGDIVRCVQYHDSGLGAKLIIGEDYEVSGVGFLFFPGHVTVKFKKRYGYGHSEYIPEDFFMDPLATKREDKIDKILSK